MTSIRPNGWYWCRLADGRDFADNLYIFEWMDNGWQVYDCIYDDDQVICLSKEPLTPPIET